jgi:protocatechuate 3,4-dioxygenase beta subunit
VTLPIAARAQDAPLGYAFAGAADDLGLRLQPTLACELQTAAQADGPFYTPTTPLRGDLIEPDTTGTPLILEGLVMTGDCQPVAGAVMDFWHCDEDGVYDNERFRYRGHQFTDSSGAFRLRTIRPGKYPARTEHIHIKMQGPGTQRLTTQIYFPDRPQENFLDRVYRDDLLMVLRRTPEGWLARFDFVLGAA